jgi:hypothetical protein
MARCRRCRRYARKHAAHGAASQPSGAPAAGVSPRPPSPNDALGAFVGAHARAVQRCVVKCRHPRATGAVNRRVRALKPPTESGVRQARRVVALSATAAAAARQTRPKYIFGADGAVRAHAHPSGARSASACSAQATRARVRRTRGGTAQRTRTRSALRARRACAGPPRGGGRRGAGDMIPLGDSLRARLTRSYRTRRMTCVCTAALATSYRILELRACACALVTALLLHASRTWHARCRGRGRAGGTDRRPSPAPNEHHRRTQPRRRRRDAEDSPLRPPPSRIPPRRRHAAGSKPAKQRENAGRPDGATSRRWLGGAPRRNAALPQRPCSIVRVSDLPERVTNSVGGHSVRAAPAPGRHTHALTSSGPTQRGLSPRYREASRRATNMPARTPERQRQPSVVLRACRTPARLPTACARRRYAASPHATPGTPARRAARDSTVARSHAWVRPPAGLPRRSHNVNTTTKPSRRPGRAVATTNQRGR